MGFSRTGNAADLAEEGSVSDEIPSKINADAAVVQDVSSVMGVSYSMAAWRLNSGP